MWCCTAEGQCGFTLSRGLLYLALLRGCGVLHSLRAVCCTLWGLWSGAMSEGLWCVALLRGCGVLHSLRTVWFCTV